MANVTSYERPRRGILEGVLSSLRPPLRPSGSLMDLKPQLGVKEEIPVDQLYQALLNAEHRNDIDRINPCLLYTSDAADE